MGHGAQTTGRQGGWPRWTEDEARTALAELAGSGQSVAEFARCRGFSTARIRYWKERLGVTAFDSRVRAREPAGRHGGDGQADDRDRRERRHRPRT
jgi:hypothetical protein